MRKLILVSSLLVGVLLMSCEEEMAEVFDPPTITVLSSISEPFAGDEVDFTIEVSAPGGLSSVTFQGQEIQAYTGGEVSDNFVYTYSIPDDAAFEPITYEFVVTDAQEQTMTASASANLVIRNPDDRGEPMLIDDMQSSYPTNSVDTIYYDSGPNSWERAYNLERVVDAPDAPANKTLKATRAGAHEWYFQGGGAVFYNLTNPLGEDEVTALVNGERRLQMNVYFEEVPREVATQNNGTQDASWTFDEFAQQAWNYDAQDSVKGIPVRVEFANREKRAFVPDAGPGQPFFEGRLFFAVSSITAAGVGGWQTLTFTPYAGTVENDEILTYPITDPNTQQTYIEDPALGFDEINLISFILNNRVTSTPHPDGYLDENGEGISISDTHNNYYIDNIRTIGIEGVEVNPN